MIGHFDMKPNQVVVFGDGYNDLSMLTAAGLGIAMGNAREDVKKQSDYVTDGNNEDGIAKALWRFVYKETQCSLIA